VKADFYIICDWCGNEIKPNYKYITYILPNGTDKHTHCKERYFPEVYKKFGLERGKYIYLEEMGENGSILRFIESPIHRHILVQKTLLPDE